MSKRAWAEEAREKLLLGQTVLVIPKGHSMQGRISDGDAVTIEPFCAQILAIGDIVLCRIQGRRTSFLVLHLVVERVADSFLIGNNRGRIDGWIASQNIFGKVVKVEPKSEISTK